MLCKTTPPTKGKDALAKDYLDQQISPSMCLYVRSRLFQLFQRFVESVIPVRWYRCLISYPLHLRPTSPFNAPRAKVPCKSAGSIRDDRWPNREEAIKMMDYCSIKRLLQQRAFFYNPLSFSGQHLGAHGDWAVILKTILHTHTLQNERARA